MSIFQSGSSAFRLGIISLSFCLVAMDGHAAESHAKNKMSEPAIKVVAATTTETNAAPAVYAEDKLNIVVTEQQPEFILQLKSNPTTGYSWFLRDYDTRLITPVKHSYVTPTTNLIGAPGYELWTFHVLPAGFTVPQLTSIRLSYARPWNSGDSPKMIVFNLVTRKE